MHALVNLDSALYGERLLQCLPDGDLAFLGNASGLGLVTSRLGVWAWDWSLRFKCEKVNRKAGPSATEGVLFVQNPLPRCVFPFVSRLWAVCLSQNKSPQDKWFDFCFVK